MARYPNKTEGDNDAKDEVGSVDIFATTAGAGR